MTDDTKERFINPYTDFGFKKLFGTEMNKDLLISFLNALLNGKEKEIEDVQYLNGENLGDGYGDRRSVFDVYCMSKDGSRFIVEMQKAEQAEIARYSESERRQYEESMFWDNYSVLKTAEMKGVKKEKIETVHRLQRMGLSVEQIAQGTNMSIDDVKRLLQIE